MEIPSVAASEGRNVDDRQAQLKCLRHHAQFSYVAGMELRKHETTRISVFENFETTTFFLRNTLMAFAKALSRA